MCVCVYNIYTYIQIYIHTYIHTHIHIYIHIYIYRHGAVSLVAGAQVFASENADLSRLVLLPIARVIRVLRRQHC